MPYRSTVDGKMHAFFRDVVLTDQPWVREPKLSIAGLMQSGGSVCPRSGTTGSTSSRERLPRYVLASRSGSTLRPSWTPSCSYASRA